MTLETLSPPTLPGFTLAPSPAPVTAPIPATAPLTSTRLSPGNRLDTPESLLDEIKRDWFPLLDPRNWRQEGPTDAEILSRYQAADTDAHETWPNVSGSRMYSLVWPTLRRTHQIPEQRFLKICRDTRTHNLPEALTHLRNSALIYSVQDDLIRRQLWNGDSYGTYRALAVFAGTPTDSLEILTTQALGTVLTRALSNFFSALATRYHPPSETPSKRTRRTSGPKIPTWMVERDQARATITRLRHLQRSPSTLHQLLTEATVGARFEDTRWPTVEAGQPLPPDLIAALLDPTFIPLVPHYATPLTNPDPNTDPI